MKSPRRSVVPSFLVCFALAACSAQSEPGSAAACNDLVHDGSTHSVALASNPATPLSGGVISDGNYMLTAARLFNVPSNVTVTRQLGSSLQIRGDVIEQVSHADGKIERRTFKYTVADTTLTMIDTCASSSAQSRGFEATSTRFELLSEEPDTGYTLHQVFSKR